MATPALKPYFDALERGVLLISACETCKSRFHYPRPFCPHCMSQDVQWLETAGTGILYSFSLMRQRGVITSAPAFVTLDEGPSLFTAIIDCDHKSLAIGQRVKLKVVPADTGAFTPFFTTL